MRIAKLCIVLLVILIINTSNAHVIDGTSFFSPRSQSTNYARDIAGMPRYRIQKHGEISQSYINATPYYSHSVRADRIADSLFSTNTITVTGSQVENRPFESLMADYFGLSPVFESVVRFKPHIQNALAIFNGHVSFDRWVNGLYFDFIVPVGWTQWYMELDEQVINSGFDVPFPELYMAESEVKAPIKSFKAALTGNVRFGQMQNPVQFGKISPCARSKRGFSDVLMALGWNCIQTDNAHFGFNVRAAIPAGTRPKSEFLFEPLLGNGKHVEIGMGFDGHVLVWEKDGTQDVILYGGANITHLFNSRQHRSFDLKHNKPLSRYMLLKEFDDQGEYASMLTPVINHTTFSCLVKMDIQVDIVLMFEYTNKGYLWDIGYNGFIRSKEKICLTQGIPPRLFGLKGIQNVVVDTELDEPSDETQSTATIFGNEYVEQNLVADPDSPRFISSRDINIESAAFPRFVTQKLFTHFGYTWCAHPRYEPFVGIGAEIEFEGINPRNNTQPVHDTLGIWGIWFKGGIAL